MAEKFRNKYRIPSSRLRGYDYARPGKYFITICTQRRKNYFGEVMKASMVLSGTGIIVRECWLNIPLHYPNVLLDEFIIMPDHLHGILIIMNGLVETPKLGFSTPGITDEEISIPETPKLGVSPYWKSNSIGSIINQFKRACTIKTKYSGSDLSWQPRYHDHIIRNQKELEIIRLYIKHNPANYKK